MPNTNGIRWSPTGNGGFVFIGGVGGSGTRVVPALAREIGVPIGTNLNRSLDNLDGWYDIFGRDAELPTMLYFECPYDVLEQRILGRAKYTGRRDDNTESLKKRFDTFKAQTLPTVELFKSKDKCIEIDTSQSRQAVYAEVVSHLAEHTDKEFASKPLTERAEMLLGLRPYPREKA